MEGEYKMFIDSLSERNKSKNAIKGFVSKYHFSREIILYLKEPACVSDTCKVLAFI